VADGLALQLKQRDVVKNDSMVIDAAHLTLLAVMRRRGVAVMAPDNAIVALQ
jgi:hypothetical protein